MEPKVFFANERTFISWLSMAVNLSSISIGVLAFTSRNCESPACIMHHYCHLLIIPSFKNFFINTVAVTHAILISLSITHTYTQTWAHAKDIRTRHKPYFALLHFKPHSSSTSTIFYAHCSHSISFRHVPAATRSSLRCVRTLDLFMEIRKDQNTWRQQVQHCTWSARSGS